jgi:hypothetical protein
MSNELLESVCVGTFKYKMVFSGWESSRWCGSTRYPLFRRCTQSFSLWGGGRLTLRLYIIYVWFQNFVTKIMSKSLNRHLVRSQGKLNVTQKEKKSTYKFFTIFFQCCNDFSGWFRLNCESRTFDIIMSTKSAKRGRIMNIIYYYWAGPDVVCAV